MLSDEEFVTQATLLNIFYLANIRGFSLNITLSFLDKEYIDRAKEFVFRCEEIGNTFINERIEVIPQLALDSNFLVTEHTLDCEYLTERLFNIDLDTDITEALLQLKTNSLKKVDESLVELMTQVNKKTLDLAREYLVFLKEIFILKKNNKLFSYAYPFAVKVIMDTMEVYIYMLERNMKKMQANPTFISNYEYRLISIMKSIAIFIAGTVNPSREDIYIRATSFSAEFNSLKKAYLEKDLNPETQKDLNLKTKKLMNRFSTFISDIISDLLKSKAYFIVEPVFLDDFYRGANYFIYNLTLIESASKEY